MNSLNNSQLMDSLIKSLIEEPISAIDGLRHSKLHLYYMKNEENQYLSFEIFLLNNKEKPRKP